MSSSRAMKKAAQAEARPAGRRGAEREASKVVKLERRPRAAPLGPGVHVAKLSRRIAEGRYDALVLGGATHEVGVMPEVDLELVDRCLAEQGVVLVGMLGDEAVVFGALQTREKKTDEIVVEASRRLVLKAGKSRLELLADGRARLSADALTLDAPREVRVVSAHMEIP